MMKVIRNFLSEQRTSGFKNLCIDFDGVVHAYSEGFKDGTIYDDPMEGVREALELLSQKYKLICWSARLNDKHSRSPGFSP